MMAEILRALANPKSNETIYIGHDSDLTGIGTMLDIGWSAPPFPDNTTAPGVGLRFETVKDSVSIQAVYTTFESDDGQLHSTPVLQESTAEFCDRATKAIDPKCATANVGLCAI